MALAESRVFSVGCVRKNTVSLFFAGTGYLIARNRDFNRRNQVNCSPEQEVGRARNPSTSCCFDQAS
ncbi:MAG: hypothetical protein V2I74_11570, partial [Erythrobacter sp.]|nr:hypothetical protein [Erythrobacter sp.]